MGQQAASGTSEFPEQVSHHRGHRVDDDCGGCDPGCWCSLPLQTLVSPLRTVWVPRFKLGDRSSNEVGGNPASCEAQGGNRGEEVGSKRSVSMHFRKASARFPDPPWVWQVPAETRGAESEASNPWLEGNRNDRKWSWTPL